jgi:hypothetical protein
MTMLLRLLPTRIAIANTTSAGVVVGGNGRERHLCDLAARELAPGARIRIEAMKGAYATPWGIPVRATHRRGRKEAPT